MNVSLDHFRQLLREQLPLLREKWKLESLELFGSRVRDDARADSDLDVLIVFERPPSLLRLIELEQFLSDLLEVKVDVAIRDNLKPRIGRRILAEAVPL